jgi:Arc/MetJ family transcription regulator
MRTNIVLDDELVAEASRLTGIRTKRDLVDEALRTLIQTKRRRSLLELRGKIRFAEGYDPRPGRARPVR